MKLTKKIVRSLISEEISRLLEKAEISATAQQRIAKAGQKQASVGGLKTTTAGIRSEKDIAAYMFEQLKAQVENVKGKKPVKGFMTRIVRLLLPMVVDFEKTQSAGPATQQTTPGQEVAKVTGTKVPGIEERRRRRRTK
tara:strand:+ start:42 stop:458 length:417 start_codon:yes stop_codon:yes gene_type:complete